MEIQNILVHRAKHQLRIDIVVQYSAVVLEHRDLFSDLFVCVEQDVKEVLRDIGSLIDKGMSDCSMSIRYSFDQCIQSSRRGFVSQTPRVCI